MKKNNIKAFLLFYINFLIINFFSSPTVTVSNQQVENEIWTSINSDSQLSKLIHELTEIPDTDKKKKNAEYQSIQNTVNTTKIPPVLRKYNIQQASNQGQQIIKDIDTQLHQKIYEKNFKNFMDRTGKRTENIAKTGVHLAVPIVAMHYGSKFLSGDHKKEKVGKDHDKKTKKNSDLEEKKDTKSKKSEEKNEKKASDKNKKSEDKKDSKNSSSSKENDKSKSKEAGSSEENAIKQDKEAEKNLKSTQSQESESQTKTQNEANETHRENQTSADKTSVEETKKEKGKEGEGDDAAEAEEGEESEGLLGGLEEGAEIAAEVAI